MKTTFAHDRAAFEAAGIIMPPEMKYYAEDAAQPGILTQVNAGIPAFLANIIQPEFFEVLLAPMKAKEITTERGIGTWTTKTTQIPVIEYTSETSTYGDYNNNGSNAANLNWIPRQQYIYQSICRWGDHELAMNALAKVDYANAVRNAKAIDFNKKQNKSYFYGIANLQNYGLLNDPNLSGAITPGTKTAGGTTWAVATANEVYLDIENLFTQLQTQLQGLVELDSKMILAMSPTSEVALTKTTQYNVNVSDMLKKNFPKMKVITAPEYSTAAGQLVQLIVPELDGQRNLFSAYGDKMRAFPVFRDLSSFRQKFTAGTWGCVITRPVAIAQMLGV
jgi:hypothetical protein